MKISIFLLIGFIYLSGNVDSLIGSFESDYKEKKMSKSKMFDKSMATKSMTNKNMTYEKKMSSMSDTPMHDTPSINKDIKNQQYNNNQEDISKVINKAIEEYMSGLIPFIIVISLFIFIVLIMYVSSSMTTSFNLRHKINVLENMLSEKLKGLKKSDSKEYNSIVNAIKKIDIRVSSIESIKNKLLNSKNETYPSVSNNKATQNKKTPIKKPSSKKTIKKENDIMLDDTLSMDDSYDEGLSLDDEQQQTKSSTPLTNLTDLDMDIGVKKNKKAKIKEMEDFSLEDFDE